MNEHTEQPKRSAAALPEDEQLELLEAAWKKVVSAQVSMGFHPLTIAAAMAAFVATCFASKVSAAEFFENLAADLRRAEAERKAAETIN